MKLSKVHRILKFKQSDWLKNSLILTQKKETIQVIILKKNFLN